MTIELLEQLKNIDPSVITEVVRKDQHNPGVVIADWEVKPFTGGSNSVFKVSNLQGEPEWAVVAKHFPYPSSDDEKPDGSDYYWQREILEAQSDEMVRIPDGLRAPRFYGVTHGLSGDWLWMENVLDAAPRKWTLDTFQRTAFQLGRFQAAYLKGHPIPAQPWLSQNFYRSVLAKGDWASNLLNPDSEGNVWTSPVVMEMFDALPEQKSRILQVNAELEVFWRANDRLPRVFSHNDAHRRNFIWTRSSDSEEELVLIDWAFSGPGALGNDLGMLVGNSMWFHEHDPFGAEILENALLDSYFAGIADRKVDVNPKWVRLGYLNAITFWIAAIFPALLFLCVPAGENGIIPFFGHTKEELFPGWKHLNAFALDRADEARSLIRELGL